MTYIRIQGFSGASPKTADHLLPEGAAQVATNLKLYSGDLIPYNAPRKLATTLRTGAVQRTLHGLFDPSNGERVWISWSKDVDITLASDTEGDEQWFYYTGDGYPKYSNYDLITSGSGPYPNPNTTHSYRLGLPLPTKRLQLTAQDKAAVNIATFRRESDRAIYTTSADHNFRELNVITIKGFEDSAAPFNAKNVTITVRGDREFEIFNRGDDESSETASGATVELSGNTQLRNYIYTWITPFSEESIPSDPSEPVAVKEGQTVVVKNLPQIADIPEDTYVRGIRLYRNITSAISSEYFRINTLWFPNPIRKIRRVANVVRVITRWPHNLIEGDMIKIGESGRAQSDLPDSLELTAEVSQVGDRFTFWIPSMGSDVSERTYTGTLLNSTPAIYYDVTALLEDSPRYWGDPDTSSNKWWFTDDFDVNTLTETVTTEENDIPPEELQGLTVAQNDILVGFFDNQLCFSFPGSPHAWPKDYRLSLDHDIVAVAALSGYILVLTKGHPYQVSGNSPETMVPVAISAEYPCLSKQSVAVMSYGVVWASYAGLVVWSPGKGVSVVSDPIHDWDTWEQLLDPSTVVSHYFEDKYFASFDSRKSGELRPESGREGFIFERLDEDEVRYVETQGNDYTFSAAWSDPDTGEMYYTQGTQGEMFQWDDPTNFLGDFNWQSKRFVFNKPTNMGAARVVAIRDVPATEEQAAARFNTGLTTRNANLWTGYSALGTMGGPIRGTAGSVSGVIGGPVYSVNEFGDGVPNSAMGDDGVTVRAFESVGGLPVSFQLRGYSGQVDPDGVQEKPWVVNRVPEDNLVFRLDGGYKAQAIEIGLSGSARVRYIELAEDPIEMQEGQTSQPVADTQ